MHWSQVNGWADEIWRKLASNPVVCVSGHGALHVHDADNEHNAGEVWTHAQYQCLSADHPALRRQPDVLRWLQQLPPVRRVENVYEEAGKLQID